jgi:UDPglucose 6-dehydrogenase
VLEAGTGDARNFPALAMAALLQTGAELQAYEPALPTADRHPDGELLTVLDDPYVAAEDADAIVILTERAEFRGLDWPRLAGVTRRSVVLDTRNLVDPDMLQRAGLSRVGFGRPPRLAATAPGTDVPESDNRP